MMEGGRKSRQPIRVPWTREQLVHERAVALGNSIDKSTRLTYNSALNSYISFVTAHELPVNPTEDTLSFFTVYMCNHISPKSVNSYLSGIVQQLEGDFPGVRAARNSRLVAKTLAGCMRMHGQATKRKDALTLEDLDIVIKHYEHSTKHDDRLFVAMLVTGFFALMRLGELTFSDDEKLHNWKKIIRRSSVLIHGSSHYEFLLPAHKADKFFEGNKTVVRAQQYRHNPLLHFQSYLNSRDHLHSLASPLWITEAGHIPTRSFFMTRLRFFFSAKIGGQSMRAGGATSLAEHGVSPSLIQAMGRWSSSAFLVYIRKNPAIIQGMLHARPATHPPSPIQPS